MENNDKNTSALRTAYAYSHLGLTFAATILAFLFGGKFLDEKWGTHPYLTLTGAFLGSAAGFYYIIKELVIKQNLEDKKEKDIDG